ncbi:MAG: hypothetical protein Hyperionvirus27_18 [Hyperionvirus sp.]|uniref:Uncharacterized protein n=1 Tax=Hyperionvirus sp. TaxID=2487770 RepID=A0A3G5AB87_9VIRU|nr:MAG: hypothetical protein Hyperionvirus27_18 [Hyperionvirus sp.]
MAARILPFLRRTIPYKKITIAIAAPIAAGAIIYRCNRHIRPYMPLEQKLFDFDKKRNNLNGKYYVCAEASKANKTEQTYSSNKITKSSSLDGKSVFEYTYEKSGPDNIQLTHYNKLLCKKLVYADDGQKKNESIYKYNSSNELTEEMQIEYVFAYVGGDEGHIQSRRITQMKKGLKDGVEEFYDAKGECYKAIIWESGKMKDTLNFASLVL